MSNTSNYNNWAKFYDQIYSSYKKDERAIALIKKYCKDKCEIVDVSCGTGRLIASLKDLGYKVSGSDLSKGMIEVASKNYPEIQFEVKDMLEINYDHKPDVILSMFNSVNHLASLDKIEHFVKNSYSNLNDDGSLIFDVNTVASVNANNSNSTFRNKLDTFSRYMTISSSSDNIVKYEVELYSKLDNGLYEKFEDEVVEYYISFDELRTIVSNYFKEFYLLDCNFQEADSKTDLIYVVAKK